MSNLASQQALSLITLILAAATLLWTASDPSGAEVRIDQSPFYFPRLVLIAGLGLAIFGLGQAVLTPNKGKRLEKPLRLVVIGLGTILYLNVVTAIGYFLASAAFTLVSLPAFGIRDPKFVTAYAVLVPGLLVFLFNHILGMPLPTSPFTYWF